VAANDECHGPSSVKSRFGTASTDYWWLMPWRYASEILSQRVEVLSFFEVRTHLVDHILNKVRLPLLPRASQDLPAQARSWNNMYSTDLDTYYINYVLSLAETSKSSRARFSIKQGRLYSPTQDVQPWCQSANEVSLEPEAHIQ